MQRLIRNFTTLVLVSFAASFGHAECPKFTEQNLSKAAIESLISAPDCNIKSFEDLFTHLPKSYFDGYTLLYKSESLQGPHQVDFLNPRAIVFGNVAENAIPPLVMTFNGNLKQPGFESLEFVEIKPGIAKEEIFRYFELTSDGKKLTLSGNNPAKCMRCHDSPARPILKTYPKWTGSYGSEAFPSADNFDIENYLRFSEVAETHSRYKFLKPIKEPQYQDLKNSISLFGTLMLNGLVKVNARVVSATPEYNKTKFSIVSAFLQCPSWPETIPGDVRNALEKNIDKIFDLKNSWSDEKLNQTFRAFYDHDDFREFPSHYNTPRARSFEEALAKINFHFGPHPEYVRLQADTLTKQGLSEESSVPAALRLLMEGRGIRIGRLFLPLDQQSYHVHEALADYRTLWLQALIAIDPELSTYATPILNSIDSLEYDSSPSYLTYDKKLCEELLLRSQEAMAGLHVPQMQKSQEFLQTSYPSIFNESCSKCHSGGGSSKAPVIPFKDEVEMRTWLNSAENKAKILNRLDGKNGRAMPPDRWITPEEKAQVIQFLDSAKP